MAFRHGSRDGPMRCPLGCDDERHTVAWIGIAWLIGMASGEFVKFMCQGFWGG